LPGFKSARKCGLNEQCCLELYNDEEPMVNGYNSTGSING